MMEELNVSHVKRTQKDFSLSFKLSVVKEIKSRELSIRKRYQSNGFMN